MRFGESSLRAELGLIPAIALVINATIGTGIFRTPAAVARHAGSMQWALVVWGLGALVALAGALSVAELSASLPRAGGIYEPLRRAFGPRVAFLYAFAKIVLLAPSAVGSFAILAAEAIEAFVGVAPDRTREVLLALAVLGVALATNLLRVRAGGAIQTVVTSLKFGGLALLAIAGLALPFTPSAAPITEHTASFAGVLAAMVSVMWAYDGWADLASVAGETKDPSRTLPRALVLGTLAVALAYVATNLGYARVLGYESLAAAGAGSEMPGSALALATLGAVGGRALAALVLVSCIGGCMASLLTNSRAFIPMATDVPRFGWLGRVHVETGTPRTAVIVTSALGVLYVASRTFEELTDGFVVGYFPFYALAVIALFVLRRKEPSLARPFRTPTVAPIVFLLGAALVMGGAVVDGGRRLLVPGIVLALGALVAWRFVDARPAPRPTG